MMGNPCCYVLPKVMLTRLSLLVGRLQSSRHRLAFVDIWLPKVCVGALKDHVFRKHDNAEGEGLKQVTDAY